MSNWYWTEEEINVLRNSYPSTQKQDLFKMLPGRDFDSIRKKAKRLGIKRNEDFIPMKDKTKIILDNAKIFIEKYNDGKSIRQIAKETNTCHATIKKIFSISNYIPKDRSNAHRTYKLNETYFDTIDTNDKAYFLGFIFADGFVYRGRNNFELGIHIHPKDISFLNLFKEKIESASPIIIDKNGYAVFRLYSQHLFEQLVSKGCVERKSLVLRFPSLNIIPKHLLSHFVRGYFDGDGTIKRCAKYLRTIQVGFVSSIPFISELNIVLNKNAGVNLVKPYCHGNYLELVYCGKGNAKKLYDFMYKDATMFFARKHKRFIEYLNLPLPTENLG